jgi:hypothetical protein
MGRHILVIDAAALERTYAEIALKERFDPTLRLVFGERGPHGGACVSM